MNFQAIFAFLLSVVTFASAQDGCADEIAAVEACLGVGVNACFLCIQAGIEKMEEMTDDAAHDDVAYDYRGSYDYDSRGSYDYDYSGSYDYHDEENQGGEANELDPLNVIVGGCVSHGDCDNGCRQELFVTLKCAVESAEEEEDDSTPPISSIA